MSTKTHKAYRFAASEHAGQVYGEFPYLFHLAQVVGVLVEHHVSDEDTICAGWLHDIIEDTAVTAEEVEALFGKPVRDMVVACTGVGSNRKERNADIAHKVQRSFGGALVKMADRIANLRNCLYTNNHSLLRMYRNEQEGFIDAVEDAYLLGPDQDARHQFLSLQKTLATL